MNVSRMKWYDRLWFVVLRAIAVVLVTLLHPLKITGRDNLPKKLPYILISNHVSAWDVLFISCMLRPVRVVYIAKTELFDKGRVVRYLLSVLGAFPVKRNTPDIVAIKAAVSVLREEQVFCIFPEGTRNPKQDGSLQPFLPGAAYLALISGAPVIPLYFANVGGFPLFRHTDVRIGSGVPLDDLRAAGGTVATCRLTPVLYRLAVRKFAL